MNSNNWLYLPSSPGKRNAEHTFNAQVGTKCIKICKSYLVFSEKENETQFSAFSDLLFAQPVNANYTIPISVQNAPQVIYRPPSTPVYSQSGAAIQPVQYRIQGFAEPAYPIQYVQSPAYIQQPPAYIQQPPAYVQQQPIIPSYQPTAQPQSYPTIVHNQPAATYIVPQPPAPSPRRKKDKSVWELLPFIPTLEPGQTVSDFEADNRDFARRCTAASRNKPQGRSELEAGLGNVLGGRNVFERPPDQPWLFRGRDIFQNI